VLLHPVAPLPGDRQAHHGGTEEGGRVVHGLEVLVQPQERLLRQLLRHRLRPHQQVGQPHRPVQLPLVDRIERRRNLRRLSHHQPRRPGCHPLARVGSCPMPPLDRRHHRNVPGLLPACRTAQPVSTPSGRGSPTLLPPWLT
jgi:hypothetical protein